MLGTIVGTDIIGEALTAPTGLRAVIASSLRTALVRNPSGWRVSHAHRQRSTAYLELGYRSSAPIAFEVGETVELWSGDELFFGGTIRSVRESFPDAAGRIRLISLECVDFSELADRRLLTARYTGKFIGVQQTTGDVVRSIVASHLAEYGVTDGGVADGETFNALEFYLVSVAEALDRIGRETGYVWWVDEERVLHYQKPEELAAPVTFSPGSRNFLSLSSERTSEELRNVQYVRGGVDRGASRTESFHGDGQGRTWTLAFDVAGGPGASGTAPAVQVNSFSRTVAIRGTEPDDDAASAEFFWEPHGARVTQNSSAAALTSSDLLEVTYDPEIPVLVVARAESAIAARAALEGGSGVYERVEEDDQVEDSIGAVNLASALLESYSGVPRRIDFETEVLGWRVGDILRVELGASHGIGGEFRVAAVDLRDAGGDTVIARVAAVDGEPLGGWVEFFRRLARRIRFPSIDTGDVLHLVALDLEELDLADSVATALGNSLIDPATDPYSLAQVDGYIGAVYLIGGLSHRVGADVGDFER